jgi:hypothetical protein
LLKKILAEGAVIAGLGVAAGVVGGLARARAARMDVMQALRSE